MLLGGGFGAICAISAVVVLLFLVQNPAAQTVTLEQGTIVVGQSTTASAAPSCQPGNPPTCTRSCDYLVFSGPQGACPTSGLTYSGCSTTPGSSGITQIPACGSSQNPAQPCVATEGPADSTISAPTPDAIPAGSYTYCSYEWGGAGGVNGPESTATLTVLSSLIVSGTVSIQPPPTVGIDSYEYSGIIQGSSANMLAEVSGIPSGDDTPPLFQDDLFILYLSNYTTSQPAGSYPCPASGTLTTQPNPQGSLNTQCDTALNTHGTSCYTNFPLSTATCPLPGTCTIFNWTPPSLPNWASYRICEYYSDDGNPADASLLSSALMFVDPTAPGWGIVVSPGANPLGGSVTLISEATTGYYNTEPNSNPSNLCNNGDQCGTEFAGSYGSQYPEDVCLGLTSEPYGWLPNASYTDPNPGGYCGVRVSPTSAPTYAGSFAYLPCVLQSERNYYYNHDNTTYTQYLNSQYIPNGEYLVCMYDYMPAPFLTGSPLYSPFFSTATVNCVNNYCVTRPITIPYTPPPCFGSNCGIGVITNNGVVVTIASNQIGIFRSTACSIYGTLNTVVLIFALVLTLLGAALYAGSSVLPAAIRGAARSYAFGFVLVAIVAFIIVAVGVWLLSIAGGVSVANVLSLCG